MSPADPPQPPARPDPGAWLAAIVESSDDAIIGRDLDGTITAWNRAAEAMFGYSAEEVIGRSVTLLADAAHVEETNRLVAESREGRRTINHETVRRRKDGTLFDVSVTVSPIHDAGGAVIGASTIARDISRRRELEQELRESRDRLQRAVVATGIGIWDWDLDTGQMQFSARAREIFGFGPDEPVTIDIVRAVTHPEDLPRTMAATARALDPAVREKVVYEYRIRRPDGALRWVTAQGDPVFEETGGAMKAVRYLGTIQDVTARVAADRRLRETNRRYALALNAAGLAVWDYDIAGRRLMPSPEFNAMFGFPPDAQPTVVDLLARHHPGDRERGIEAARLADAGHPHFATEFRVIRPDGGTRWLSAVAERIDAENGTAGRIIGILRDVTEAKRAEELQRSSAEARELAARELSHRVKNTLQLVSSVLGLQAMRITEPALAEEFGVAHSRVSAIAQTHAALYDSGRGGVAGLEVGRLLHSLGEGLASVLRAGEQGITLEVAADQTTIPADIAVPLALIANELITNALKYAFEPGVGGRIRVAFADDAECGFRLTVTDDGRGLPDSPVGRPGGVGLELVSALVQQIGGALTMDGSGRGVTATVTGRTRAGRD